MDWIGLDIGGANIKLASGEGQFSFPFELWKYPDQLTEFLGATVIRDKGLRVAVTMTGELADGYPDKETGVGQIVDSVEQVAPGAVFYQTPGRFVDAVGAKADWLNTAAANWHAMACWVSRSKGVRDGFLIDMGSTTTDLIPIQDGVPCSGSFTDLQRLASGELIYTGIRRSAVCGLLDQVELEGDSVNLANEFFATIEDVYVLLGRLPERMGSDTADGRPQQKRFARQRLARMLCSDYSEVGGASTISLAEQISLAQRRKLVQGIERVFAAYPELPCAVMVSGEGEWLIREILSTLPGNKTARLTGVGSLSMATCAPAVAVRELAAESKCLNFA